MGGNFTMYDNVKDNAHRLANVLQDYSNDKTVINALSYYLNYEPTQLVQDMQDIKLYIKRLESN